MTEVDMYDIFVFVCAAIGMYSGVWLVYVKMKE